ncbi:class II glutamine amidotransferase [uncultured Cohaesibacter sp.]|uniref:class II glutamine amidotransferase n=1 Tax=uncultured Cohaesibacter sp. TaxID=1002546 RepID=UPI0029306026|nr:class II glutamine amidotransferase [uncultured Cohaesibacter sp.]
MCRWVAYKGQPVFLEHYVTKADHSLIHQSLHAEEGKTVTNGDGFGIGWYGAKENPGLYREILPAWNDCNLKSLASQIQSPLFFAHVRASTGTATNRCNCHPFAHGKWMFMHNGQIGEYERIRRVLEADLDDAHYDYRLGSTDSELLFLLSLQNAIDDCPIKAMMGVLNRVHKAMVEKGIEAPLRFTSCLSDGKRLCGFRCSTDHHAPSLYYRRYENGDVILVSEPIDRQSECWTEVPQDQAVCFRADGEMTLSNIQIQ